MSSTRTDSAAARWADALAGWAVPPEILDAAPEGSSFRFPPEIFGVTPERAAVERAAPSVSRQRALEALPDRGTVLDVGAGGDRASLSLAPPASFLVAVDPSAELLVAFAEAAERETLAYRTVQGQWPDVADQVESADVVVCHHVVYNVPDLVPFARALTEKARHRVVLELTVDHPTINLNQAWRVLHGVERPTTPTGYDAVAVLQEMGLDVAWELSERQGMRGGRSRADTVAFARRRLCVGPERETEIDALLPPDEQSALRHVLTVWWDGPAER